MLTIESLDLLDLIEITYSVVVLTAALDVLSKPQSSSTLSDYSDMQNQAKAIFSTPYF